MKILVDPYVIAIPSLAGAHFDRVEAYVEGMKTWIGATSIPPVEVFYSSEYISRLMETNQFPFIQTIARLLSASSVTHYDSQTVSRLFLSLFDSWKDIEDSLQIASVACELDIEPACFIERMPEHVSDMFFHCLCRVILQRDAGDTELAHMSVGTCPDTDASERKLIIRGVVTDFKANESIVSPDFALGQPPIAIDSEFGLLLNREYILASLDWPVIWEYPSYAVEKAYYSAMPQSDRANYALQHFHIGQRFINTIVGLGLHTQSGRIRSIYETCALIICGYAPRVA